MAFPVVVGLSYGEEKKTYTENQNGRALGTVGILADGRRFRWAQAGAVALVAGNIIQTKVQATSDSLHTGALDISGGAVGVTTLSVTFAATATTLDLYKDGYLNVDTSPGQGLYHVSTNESATCATAGVVTFSEDDKIVEALTSGTSKVGLFQNPYADVIVSPAEDAQTGAAIGASVAACAAASFCWIQTWGPATIEVDVAPIVGDGLQLGATAGNLTPKTSVLTSAKLPTLAVAWTGTAAGTDKYTVVFLTLPG